jgi:hypothetical protein
MRYRIWALIAFAMLLVVAVSCVGGKSARGPVGTPVPTKTLRPTFTHTPPRPTEVWPTATPATPVVATPAPEATQAEPTPTLEPTAEPPTATPEPAAFTVTSATVNVRSGPGTSYSRIGQLRAGQTYEITGKNDTGDWWQFSLDGDPAWVAAQMVQANGADAVEVAANIPALPTAVKRQPQPAAKPAPKPAAPTAVPAPAGPPSRYAVGNAQPPRSSTNAWITVLCRVGPSGVGNAGTMRLMREGQVIEERAFGMELDNFNAGIPDAAPDNYNRNCKVEKPAVEGNYTAVLIEGGQPISDVATFTVSGDLREFHLRWVPK